MAKHSRPLLLFGYSSVDAWPITYDKDSSIDPNINLKSYDKLILKGKPLIQPRLEKVPIRIPLPRKSDSIYQLQNKKSNFINLLYKFFEHYRFQLQLLHLQIKMKVYFL